MALFFFNVEKREKNHDEIDRKDKNKKNRRNYIKLYKINLLFMFQGYLNLLFLNKKNFEIYKKIIST